MLIFTLAICVSSYFAWGRQHFCISKKSSISNDLHYSFVSHEHNNGLTIESG